jgi:branched-chain amino acid transport system substrate-binding protein
MQRNKRLFGSLSGLAIAAGLGLAGSVLATAAVAQSGEIKIGEINSYSLACFYRTLSQGLATRR